MLLKSALTRAALASATTAAVGRTTSVVLTGSTRLVPSTTTAVKRLQRSHAASTAAANGAADDVVAELNASSLVETLTDSPKPKPTIEGLAFGTKFSDHMLTADWTHTTGWAAPEIRPLENFSMHPASCVLHYAVECFEGMKAYRGDDGATRLFRPDLNARRFQRSASRISLPAFDEDAFVQLITRLVAVDRDWVPEGEGRSLYLRPTMIATQAALGVAPTTEARMFCIASPVGPYYAKGFAPVTLLADPTYTRAWPGGVGFTKCGGNYAATLMPMNEATTKHGCEQVMWLYGEEELVTEVGTMNLLMHWINEQGVEELITAPLDDMILDGVTRRSTLDLARNWGEFDVREAYFSMPQLLRALDEGRVKEIFGVGTAATVSPVGGIVYKGEKYEIPLARGNIGHVGDRIKDELFDIQYGRKQHEWAVVVPEQ